MKKSSLCLCALSLATKPRHHLHALAALFGLLTIALVVPTAVSARTVYDAGKALRQNCESGSYANPYTDSNGGVWSYYYAS